MLNEKRLDPDLGINCVKAIVDPNSASAIFALSGVRKNGKTILLLPLAEIQEVLCCKS
jgi:hypothetical protein